MNGRETIFSILNYYNENKIDFDVYIVADACKFRFIGSPIPLATDQCFRL